VPKTRAELIAAQEKVRAVYPQARAELLRIPGVVKVGIGMKEVAGVLTEETVLRVYVVEKKASALVPPGELIPPVVQGLRTDVIVVLPDSDEDDESKYRPIKGGIQINRAGTGSLGTLGCLAHLVADDTTVLLSNHHVLYGAEGVDGTECGQPDYTSSCCCTCGDIAVNLHGIRRDHLDLAIARIKPGIGTDAQVHEIGAITGVADAVSGEDVKKRGRTTGLTTGKVSNLEMDGTGLKILNIEVKKDNGNLRFSRPGDSGSALLNSDNQIIGLHKSGNNGDDVAAGSFKSTSIGIQEVLDALDTDGFAITILTTPGGDEELHRVAAAAVGFGDVLWTIEQRLQQAPAGAILWAAVRRHQQEALRLVNQVRPVTVAWHRHQGPSFLAALGRSAKEPAYRIPYAIDGMTRPAAVAAILAQFEQHGSPALRGDLARFGAPLAYVLAGHDTLEEMVLAWQVQARTEPEASAETLADSPAGQA
jgi:hypothetical protein